MTICFVCGEYPPYPHGGIGSMVQTLGRALVAAGHAVRVVGLYAGLPSPVREADEGVEVWRLQEPRAWGGWIAGRCALFRCVKRWAERGEIDLVEVPDWQGWAAHWRRLPVPVVTRANGSATYFAREMGRCADRVTQHLERASLRRSDVWCAVSRYTARRTQTLFGLRAAPAAILPNAVDDQAPAHFDARTPGKVVFTGTLTEKKGVIPLLDAWPRVARECPHATLHVIGKDGLAPGGGSMVEYLTARIEGDAARRVRFHGRVPRERVLAELRTARVAVFPSFAEAFAIAPLEAMAVGCPTIGTALGSGPELIDDGIDGLTVDPHHPGQIAQAICRLLGDEDWARQLGDRGRAKVERQFTWRVAVQANLEFFAACVARRRPRCVRVHASASWV
ncbi:MAG TPA: glycosyltransferase family 4 protein [Vicinamibacterales bacterium]|nr:glycosyltransferase family 4 protein [Vicinamibacterales bacterium]